MQHRVVMAFRKRLKGFGYTRISIVRHEEEPDKYRVSAVEPLSKADVSVVYSLVEMYHSFK